MSTPNMLAVGTKLLAFAGKSGVYFRTFPFARDEDNLRGNPPPELTFSEEWKSKNGHIECICVSKDDKLIAVADSLRCLHLYEIGSTNLEWKKIFMCSFNKRMINVQFTSDEQYITVLDKQGDIFAVRISPDHSQFSKAKKILGHTSFISDYIACAESQQIVSCDRDEKIRISNFPDSFVIQGFKLGHTESVINLSLIQYPKQRSLLSISVTGVLILWNFTIPSNGTDIEYVKLWNVKDLLSKEYENAEIKTMKACLSGDQIFVGVAFGGLQKAVIIKLSVSSSSAEICDTLDTDSEMVIMDWAVSNADTSLIIYTPILASVRWFSLFDDCKTLRNNGIDNLPDHVIKDIKEMAATLKPTIVPMKKRQTVFEDNLHSYNKEDQPLKKVTP